MNKKLIELIKEEFVKLISVKTGWGYKEILNLLDKAIANATLRLLDES